MMNYPLPATPRDPKWEELYQAVVARAFRTYEGQTVLLQPRKRMRGWSWKHYTKRNKE